MGSEQKLLTVKELASMLRLSNTETYRLIQTGEIVHFRVGPGKGAIRIIEKDVFEFLEQRRVGGKKAVSPPAIRSRALKHLQTKK